MFIRAIFDDDYVVTVQIYMAPQRAAGQSNNNIKRYLTVND